MTPIRNRRTKLADGCGRALNTALFPIEPILRELGDILFRYGKNLYPAGSKSTGNASIMPPPGLPYLSATGAPLFRGAG